MKKYNLNAFIILFALFLSSCSPKFKPAEYTTTSESISAEDETMVSLDDGASISIPPDSIEGNATVKVERNPEKAKDLPPIPDEMVQLSDFYNFEIEDAELVGPVDITIPVDETKLPSEAGIPFAMIPTPEGWKYIPVEIMDGKATFYTYEIGDPLIAWHFTDRSLSEEEDQKAKYICDPDIAVQAIDNGDGSFLVLGQIKPPIAHKQYNDILQIFRNPGAGIPVSITLNKASAIEKNFQVVTNDDGYFGLTLNPENGIQEGKNQVLVNTKCDPWFSQISIESTGKVDFEYSPSVPTASDIATETPTEIPVAQPETIQPPKTQTEYIQIPNVVGLPFDTAKELLERIGYKVIWIDGKSTFEIGQVYSQAPRAGTLTVPHRTTIVLYRTTEKRELTPTEELANTLIHVKYETTSCNIIDWDNTDKDCHYVYEVTNSNGKISTYTLYDDPYNPKLKPYENEFSLVASINQPLFGQFYAWQPWWLPQAGNSYDIEEIGNDLGVTTAHTLVPGSISNIDVAGYSFQVQEYNTEFDDTYHDDAWSTVTTFQVSAFYDTKTGLLIKADVIHTMTACQVIQSYMDCGALGMQMENVYEISELSLNLP